MPEEVRAWALKDVRREGREEGASFSIVIEDDGDGVRVILAMGGLFITREHSSECFSLVVGDSNQERMLL